MKKYKDFMNINEFNFNIFNNSENKEDELKKLSIEELGREGKLAEYIDSGGKVKFGVLKAIYQDAVEYKKKREYEKGVAKFAVRAIPLALGPLFFPIWLLSQILGATRAINKILVPALKVDHKNYESFLKTVITKTMDLAEGDIKPFLGNDWFYDVFSVHDGLAKMVRKEYLYDFSVYITEEIQKKKDDEIVPQYWLDNEFRKWLNEKFNIDLPVGKRMIKNIEKTKSTE